VLAPFRGRNRVRQGLMAERLLSAIPVWCVCKSGRAARMSPEARAQCCTNQAVLQGNLERPDPDDTKSLGDVASRIARLTAGCWSHAGAHAGPRFQMRMHVNGISPKMQLQVLQQLRQVHCRQCMLRWQGHIERRGCTPRSARVPWRCQRSTNRRHVTSMAN
jgi:hypothetical protein